MRNTKRLHLLSCGESGTICGINSESGISSRLSELGFIAGTNVTCLAESPLKDPKAYLVRGTVIALRRRDAECINVCCGEADES